MVDPNIDSAKEWCSRFVAPTKYHNMISITIDTSHVGFWCYYWYWSKVGLNPLWGATTSRRRCYHHSIVFLYVIEASDISRTYRTLVNCSLKLMQGLTKVEVIVVGLQVPWWSTIEPHRTDTSLIPKWSWWCHGSWLHNMDHWWYVGVFPTYPLSEVA
jgi:hypothetical protein